jgi:hypothetical protein
MDNDLMARRLRPPSQPNAGQPAQPSSPWDVSLTSAGDFAPPDDGAPPQDPPFFPSDPAARADVPWDRPAPEVWPPSDDQAPSQQTPPIWSSQSGAADPTSTRPEWPAADPLGDGTPPWDRPDAYQGAQWQDPDDAMAPVVGDVPGPVAWASWNADGNGNGELNGNGRSMNTDATDGSTGMGYAAAGTPDPITVTAHTDRPTNDEPHDTAAFGSYPEWPAEDDLTPITSPDGSPVMPEDLWPVTPQPVAPAPPAPAAEASAPEQPVWLDPHVAEPEPEPEAAPEPVLELAPEPETTPEPEPENQPEPALATAPPPQPAVPVTATPSLELSTDPNTHIVSVTPSGTPQNMVLRIELAIVDESQRANPADDAKRVGPDADVRRPEYEPRQGDSDLMPEPEYVWGAPPPDKQEQQSPWRTQSQAQPGQQPTPPTQPTQPQVPQVPQYSPSPSSWLPAPQQAQPAPQPQQPQAMDWDLPQLAAQQPPPVDPPAPWSTPQNQAPSQQQSAPPPTWAMTQPTPPFQPEPAQYMPPPTPQPQEPAAPHWPPQPQQAPQAAQYPAAAPGYQQPPQAAWPPQQNDPLYGMPAASQYQAQPAPQMAQSAPAAGSHARIGEVAADQADLWFLNNQPAATAADDDVHPAAKSNSILTAGLTIGFALLVIVLVLVFIQLMTSLLR